MPITHQLSELLAQLTLKDLAEMPPLEFDFLARRLETWATLAASGQRIIKGAAAADLELIPVSGRREATP